MVVQNLEHLQWDMNPRGTQGTAGTFLKAYENPYYYKMSAGNAISGIYGHEAVNEVIVSRLLQTLGIPCLAYVGFLANVCVNDNIFTTYVCRSKEFKKQNESKLRLETYYELHKQGTETPIQFLQRLGFEKEINQILFTDYLIINRDRHGANIELLFNKHTRTIRIAPIFDNGVSFVAPWQHNIDVIKHFNALQDVQANNFLGTYSLEYNLQYITASITVNALNDKKIKQLFYGLHEVLTDEHIAKITEIITKRYIYAKEKKILCER